MRALSAEAVEEGAAKGRRLLLIAPIGDPAYWRRAVYTIDGSSYETCCSALALAIHNARNCRSVTILLQALDSLVCSQLLGDWGPGVIKDRERIAGVLRQLFSDELLRVARELRLKADKSGESVIVEGHDVSIEVALSQSAGEYAVNRQYSPAATIHFDGEPTSAFSSLFNRAMLLLPDNEEVILDLTHGINYLQAMAVYAVEVLRALFGTRIRTYNFSPYPALYTSDPCFVAAPFRPPTRLPAAPRLTALDASSLVQLSRMASSISQLMLHDHGVRTIRSSIAFLRRIVSDNFMEFAKSVALAWYYMGRGVATISYLNALEASRLAGSAPPAQTILKDLEAAEASFKFRLGSKSEVRYDLRSDWRVAVPAMVWSMYNKLADLLPPSGTTITLDYLKRAVEGLARENPLYQAVAERIAYEKGRFLSKSRRLGKSSFSLDVDQDRRELLGQPGQAPPLPLSEQPPRYRMRHMTAHAGITYEPVVKVEIVEGVPSRDVLLTLDPGNLGYDPFGVWAGHYHMPP